MPTFCKVTRGGGRVSCSQPRLPSQESEIPAFSNFWVLLHHPLTQNNQIWCDNTYGEEVCFYGSGIPQNFSDLHHVRPNGLTYSDQIWYDNTRGIEACFQGVSRAPSQWAGAPASQKFWDRLRTPKLCGLEQPNLLR